MQPGQLLHIVHNLIKGQPVSPFLEGLNDEEIISFQNFMWEKTIEIGILVKGKYFSIEEVTSKMISPETYQKQQKCHEMVNLCKTDICLKNNPQCAIQKIKGQVEVMASAIHRYFKLASRNVEEMVRSI